MNNRQRKTLEAIFTQPIPTDLAWEDIESLLLSVGAKKTEGSGSRIRFELEKKDILLHKPHNPKIMRTYQIKLLKEFFEKVGIRP